MTEPVVPGHVFGVTQGRDSELAIPLDRAGSRIRSFAAATFGVANIVDQLDHLILDSRGRLANEKSIFLYNYPPFFGGRAASEKNDTENKNGKSRHFSPGLSSKSSALSQTNPVTTFPGLHHILFSWFYRSTYHVLA